MFWLIFCYLFKIALGFIIIDAERLFILFNNFIGISKMRNNKKLGVIALMLSSFMISNSAQAMSTLSGTFTVDDEYSAYLSTSETSIDGADTVDLGSNAVWNESSSFSDVALLEGTTYYLHIMGSNAEKISATRNPSGFLGDFSLSDNTSHNFTGSSTTDGSTGIGAWTYGLAGWGEGNAVVNAQGPAGQDRNWGGDNAHGVAQSGLSDISASQWVWSSDHSIDPNTAYFTLEIRGNDNQNLVPVPGAVWLFGTGLLGFIGMRKKAVKA
jgi:hypothetical protein